MDEYINWNILGKDFWLSFGKLDRADRRKFLMKNNLQYKGVPRCKICKKVFFNCEVYIGKNDNHEDYFKKHNNGMLEYNKPFSEKLKHSIELTNQVLDENTGKKIFLAYSGGIDSECCIQLFKEEIKDGRITVVIGDTLVEFPETRKRWNELREEIPTGKFIVTRPELGVSFKIVSRKYGLPVYSRSSNDKDKRKATSMCCLLLKKKPMKKATKEAEVLILGLRAEENQNRKLGIFNKGDYFYSETSHTSRVYPIAYWKIEDVWEFQRLYGFKYNNIYDNTNCEKRGFYKLENGKYYHIRTGCWCCPQSIMGGYLEWLEHYYPQFYNALVNNLGMKNHVIWAKIEAQKAKLREQQQKPCGEPI